MMTIISTLVLFMVGARPLQNTDHIRTCYGVVMERPTYLNDVVVVSKVLTWNFVKRMSTTSKRRSAANTPSRDGHLDWILTQHLTNRY